MQRTVRRTFALATSAPVARAGQVLPQTLHTSLTGTNGECTVSPLEGHRRHGTTRSLPSPEVCGGRTASVQMTNRRALFVGVDTTGFAVRARGTAEPVTFKEFFGMSPCPARRRAQRVDVLPAALVSRAAARPDHTSFGGVVQEDAGPWCQLLPGNGPNVRWDDPDEYAWCTSDTRWCRLPRRRPRRWPPSRARCPRAPASACRQSPMEPTRRPR